MKATVGVVAIACAVGCMGDSPDTSQAQQATGVKCPDPTDCTLSNGGGVYTEECGNAHFGSNDYMITRFINEAGHIYVEGRGYNPSTGNYEMRAGDVIGAHYLGANYTVVNALKETLTTPEFDLDGSGGPRVIGDNIVYTVTGFDLRIRAEGGDYTLTFWAPWHEREDIGGNEFPLNSYYVKWNPGDAYDSTLAQDYCRHAPDGDYNDDLGTKPCPFAGLGSADSVVFQAGIGVNPVNAHMVRNGTYVTMSCRDGAIATARSWGYKYRGTDDDLTLFEASMQMKRASYCGDEFYYTKPHTKILMKDASGNLQDPVTASDMEASWGPTGAGIHAVCINKYNYRHKEMIPADFDATCGGSTIICPLTGSAGGSDGTGLMADRKDPDQTWP